jgi:hypothetical protein
MGVFCIVGKISFGAWIALHMAMCADGTGVTTSIQRATIVALRAYCFHRTRAGSIPRTAQNLAFQTVLAESAVTMDAEVHVAPVLLARHARTISASVARPTALAKSAVTMDAEGLAELVPLDTTVPQQGNAFRGVLVTARTRSAGTTTVVVRVAPVHLVRHARTISAWKFACPTVLARNAGTTAAEARVASVGLGTLATDSIANLREVRMLHRRTYQVTRRQVTSRPLAIVTIKEAAALQRTLAPLSGFMPCYLWHFCLLEAERGIERGFCDGFYRSFWGPGE